MFVPKKALGQVVPYSSVGKLAQGDALASIPREAQAPKDPSSQHLTGYLPFTGVSQYKITKANSINTFFVFHFNELVIQNHLTKVQR